jgi:ABC-type Mn2+/Zn2+ transport system permease subunit
MSLKAFHLFFIAIAIVLAAFMTAWATRQYRSAHDAIYLLTAVGCAAFGAVLIVYAARFQRKARRL